MKKKTAFLLAYFSILYSSCNKNNNYTSLDFAKSDFQNTNILISEILPDPRKGGVEFVEIYNNSTKVIDLNSFQLASTNSAGKRSKLHPISISSLYIYPFNYKLLSLNSEIVKSQYTFQNEFTFHTMQSFPTLTNTKGSVILFDKEEIVDSLFYTVDMHDIFIKNPKGVSLERVSFHENTNAIGNFKSSATGNGYATPGYQNSQYIDHRSEYSGLFLNSRTFAPNQNEQLEINLSFPPGGKMSNIFIFNSAGRRVRTLLSNHRLATTETVKWDGKNDKKEQLSIGVYHIYVEIYDSEGNFQKFKESCILAEKN